MNTFTLLLTLNEVDNTVTRSHTVDVLVREELTNTHTVDALVKNIQTTTHTLDAFVRSELTATHTIDTLARAEATATHTVDTLARTENTVTHTADTLVLAEVEASHTIDVLVSEPSTFKRATVNSSKVAATLSDYPSYVDLSRVGITTLAEAQSVRVYSDESKTTELPREIVSVDEMHVKISSLTTTTTIYVDYDGVRSDYAATDTYGRNAVWSDYGAVYHLNEDPSGTAPQMIDSTGNGNDLTSAGSMTSGDLISGKVGKGLDFDNINDALSTADSNSLDVTTGYTLETWVNLKEANEFHDLIVKQSGATWTSPFASYLLRLTNTASVKRIELFQNSGGSLVAYAENTTLNLDTWYHVVGTYNKTTRKIFLDGSQLGSGSALTTNVVDSSHPLLIGNLSVASIYRAHYMDEVRISTNAKPDSYAATSYNNQSDEATFWGTWEEVGPETGCFLLKEDGDFLLQETGDKILLESCPGAEETVTHSIDTLVREELTNTHTVDVLVREELTNTHTVDTLVKAEQTNTHTVDTLVKAEQVNTHTVDTLVKATETATHTTDTFVRREDTATHTADTLVRAVVDNTHTVDTLVRATETNTHTIDTLVLAEQTVSHSIDTVVWVPGEELNQHTIDVLVREDVTTTHTADTLVHNEETATHTVDTLVLAEETATHTIDVLVRDATSAGNIKYWNGTDWEVKQLKYWNGATWVDAPLKRWNGVDWELITY